VLANAHRVAAGLEQELVSDHVHSQLFITEGVDASSSGARGGADLLFSSDGERE